jgi:glycosyltransferase involved in cell wall biosynthesis
VFRGAAYLLPFSRFAKESLVTDYGIPEEKISIVPQGIDLKIWSGRPKHLPTTATPSSRLQVLFVGGDFARKGGALLLNIAGRKEFQQCDFHFVTRGFSGPSGDNIFVYDNLEANSEALIALYRQAHIFALPTRADFSPNAIYEAMAMELPVVSTRIGAIDEMVVEGESGFVVPVDDKEAFIDRLRTLVCNAELRTRLGRNGRRLVESRFNLETMAESIVRFLIKAAKTRPA